jgi:hypothetical protein
MTLKCRSDPAMAPAMVPGMAPGIALDKLCGVVFSNAVKAAKYTAAVYLSGTRHQGAPAIWTPTLLG